MIKEERANKANEVCKVKKTRVEKSFEPEKSFSEIEISDAFKLRVKSI